MRFSLLCLVVIAMIVIGAPLLTDADPLLTDASRSLEPPSMSHWLGTDFFGRDIWSRLLYGGRQTLTLLLIATITAIVPGTLVGILIALSPAGLATVLTILLDTLLAFPSLLLALFILAITGQGMIPVAIATGLAQMAFQARVIRVATLQVQNSAYVMASRAMGGGTWHVIRYHLLRGIQPVFYAYTAIVAGYCLLNAAALSFLGLGGDPSVPEWGRMLAEGRQGFRSAPHAAIAPGIVITLVIFLINRLADDLSERPHS